MAVKTKRAEVRMSADEKERIEVGAATVGLSTSTIWLDTMWPDSIQPHSMLA